MGLARGKIIFINQGRTFGFIRNYHDHKNYYVHRRDFLENLELEDEVEFDLIAADKRLEAIRVKKF